MEKENQTIEELKDKKVDLNKQFEVRRAAVQAKERFNQLLQSNATFYVVATQRPSRTIRPVSVRAQRFTQLLPLKFAPKAQKFCFILKQLRINQRLLKSLQWKPR